MSSRVAPTDRRGLSPSHFRVRDPLELIENPVRNEPRARREDMPIAEAVLLPDEEPQRMDERQVVLVRHGDVQAPLLHLRWLADANAVKLDTLNEQINAAEYQLDQANATIVDSEARIAVAKAQTDALQKLVEQRAVSIYQSATWVTTPASSTSTRASSPAASSTRRPPATRTTRSSTS